ncbi:hypothetical protein [Colwellia echini]|uniref:Uncharacterized protein n=1 Tax=Colwellia echini TaxID=1982103 RepID=A0ABY3MUI4_9GAMM|nr:hypothetical protein [Colwellia echini]TYK64862.1 hypothetical protein CWS31_013690 [Colwellia echini]
MEIAESSKTPKKAYVILTFQAITWALIISHFFEDYITGTDAAGSGMARGIGVFFFVVPSMIFIFCTTFYFLKKNLPAWFRFVSTFNYIGLFLTFAAINW